MLKLQFITFLCRSLPAVVIFGVMIPNLETVEAQSISPGYVICERRSNGALIVRQRCHRRQARVRLLEDLRGPAGDTGPQGPVGPAGPEGESGVLGIYGDGSSGNVNLTTPGQLEAGTLFHNITIPAATTLVIPSGITLRCSGTFTNQGTIEVSPFAIGASHSNNEGDHLSHVNVRPAAAGLSAGAAGNGGSGVSGNPEVPGGVPAAALNSLTARALLNPGASGGGGGGAPGFSTANVPGLDVYEGGAGGGTLRVLCQGGVYNEGTITASGLPGTGPGTGGGAGGIVILASSSEIVNSGLIQASAANGNNASQGSAIAAGGGGGGGYVHLLAPIVDNAGLIEVAGGNGGTTGGGIPPSDASGGGAGGSLAGSGGAGGDANNTAGLGANGEDGEVFTTIVFNPAYLFQ